jgi:hypothetical protein
VQHDSVERAAELMASHGIHSLPVVNSAGHLVGILTTTDIISAMFDAPPALAHVVCDEHPHGIIRMTREQLGRAVALAKAAVDERRDPDGVAAALIHAQHRIVQLEGVVALAARYITSGQDVDLHAVLGKAIAQARAAEVSEHTEARTVGLGAA